MKFQGKLEKTPEIWVLVDDIAGHKSQALGVAEALEMPFIIKKLCYNEDRQLPNFLSGASIKGIDLEKSDKFTSPWPDIVIAAGRKTAPVARLIKKQVKEKAGKKCFLAQIMWPGFPARDFDLIATPEHDNRKEKGNIITTIGAPHRVNDKVMAREAAMWGKTLGNPERPRLALLLGGNVGNHEFTRDHAEHLSRLVSELMSATGGTLWVTNSRRTNPEITQIVKDKLTSYPGYEGHFYDCNKSRANPYYAFLALSDAIIVTGDSISMCSEACASGKPVYIYAPDDFIPAKHKKMHQSLYERGYATGFCDKEIRNISAVLRVSVAGEKNPLNTAKYVAEKIKERFINIHSKY